MSEMWNIIYINNECCGKYAFEFHVVAMKIMIYPDSTQAWYFLHRYANDEELICLQQKILTDDYIIINIFFLCGSGVHV